MKSYTFNIIGGVFIVILLHLAGCQKDPYDGVQSNEKSIENFTMGAGFTQIGAAQVDRTNGKVKIQVLVSDDTDFSKVNPIIQQSYRATVSPESGAQVDFIANDYKVKYTVTSEKGESREWEVEIDPFEETIIGTYDITDLVLYGGTGPEYGGGGVFSMPTKPWLWSTTDGPQAELDNKLTFTLTGVTPSGRTTGKFINDAGADGLYANFTYVLDPRTDVNHFYRKLPMGEGTWERDYSTDILYLIFADGTRVSCSFLGPTTESLGNGITKSIQNNAFAFSLNGVDDWNAIYSDFDKVVKKPRRFWVEIKKQN